MLDILFMICAGVGGAIMLIQFGLMFLGIGDDGLDGAIDGDLNAGGGLDADVDLDGGLDTDADHHTSLGDAADADYDHPGSMWLFQVISLRGIVAAIAFFGLGGMWAQASEMAPTASIAVGAGLGLAAMYGVYWTMQQLYKLRASGTINIANAVGKEATIYIPVPGGGDGRGKIQVTVQNRTMEYEAITDDAERLGDRRERGGDRRAGERFGARGSGETDVRSERLRERTMLRRLKAELRTDSIDKLKDW